MTGRNRYFERSTMKHNLQLLTTPLAGVAGLFLVAAICANAAEPDIELFRDDFSSYPTGPLTKPVGKLNAAVQEYHYLPHRGVPLEPWANAICHINAWAAGRDDGQSFVEQRLRPGQGGVIPKLFSPLFVTGEPEWGDYTVEVTVRPLDTQEMAGVVFRYHTNRHHYLFCLQEGTHARLALRLPIEQTFRVADWKELGRVEFPYDANKSYRLKVATRGENIRCFIDDQPVLAAESPDLPTGKVGIAATIPARFQDFRVSVSPATKRAIAERLQKRNDELARLQADNPRPRLWKKFDTPKFGAGRNGRFGDLDGDGTLDMLIGQNIPKTASDAACEISCLTAVTLDGTVLWQMGEPDPANGLLTCDTPFQIHDIDGDGRQDVVLAQDRRLKILDGRTGRTMKSVAVPKVKDYPQVPQLPGKNWPTDVSSGDSIVFVNFSGQPGPREIVLKDRYWNFWVFDRDLKQLWNGQGMLGHYPYAVPAGANGREQLAIGYALWDGTGKQLWSVDQQLKEHADSVAIGNFSGDPQESPLAYYSGSDEGFVLIDHRGLVRRHVRVGHTQTAAIGKFRPDLPGLQYAAINFWKNPGIVSLFQHDGELLQQGEPVHMGSPFLPVNWRGDGQEFILLSGNVREGGMIDGHLRRAVMFPDDGHPDLCAAAMDLTSDPRDEIVLWDQERVWIYTQDRPFEGKKIYAPVRNPHCNESNYRCTVSRPGWKDH